MFDFLKALPPELGGSLRHVASTVGGLAVGFGLATQGQADAVTTNIPEIVGGVTAIAGAFGFSIFAKEKREIRRSRRLSRR